jgi:hypothetical protein
MLTVAAFMLLGLAAPPRDATQIGLFSNGDDA